MNSTESVHLTQYEALIAGYIQGNISFEAVRYLASFMDNCQQYVIPIERTVCIELCKFINANTEQIECSKDAFDLYLLMNTIEATVNTNSQKRILSWMCDSDNSAIALY